MRVARLVFSLQLAVTVAPTALSDLGCFHFGYAYSYFKPNGSEQQESVADCQARCAEESECHAFTFWEDSKSCDFAGGDSLLQTRKKAVSGPATCEGTGSTNSACVERPDGSFPGTTAGSSAAAWPSGEVPTNLQCWPFFFDGKPNKCSHVTVLEDTEQTGWHGACSGLWPQTLDANQSCEEACRNNMFCSGWQERNYTNPPQCLHGVMPVSCYGSDNSHASRAQRIMHGTYRVLKDLKGLQIMGLTRMFTAAIYSNSGLAAAHCRLYCIAALDCQYWTYSKVWGCWAEKRVDSQSSKIKYPLTKANARRATAFAVTVVAGEYIQHLCDGGDPAAGQQAVSEVAAATTADKGKDTTASREEPLAPGTIRGKTWSRPEGQQVSAPDKNGFPFWLICLLIAVVACCFVAAAVGLRSGRFVGTSKPKEGRRNRPAADEKPLLSAEREGVSEGSGSDGSGNE